MLFSRVFSYKGLHISKFLINVFSNLAGTGVTTYSLHPGVINTDLTRHIPLLHLPVVKHLYGAKLVPFFKDALHGAQTSVCCAVDPTLSEQSGKYYRRVCVVL